MNKKLILSLLAILLLTTCKKEKTAEIDAVGTYSLYSWSAFSSATYSIENTPCLADNMLILRADNTSWAFYKGSSPCRPNSTFTVGSTDTTRTAWHVDNGRFYFNSKQKGEITTVNGKLQITTRDTITSAGGSSGIIIAVFKKQ
ncbi:hypothetical protein IDJ77_09355 [Mucilaginibacter sp. ZT4R22]|uniref:Lipocalin-like protein n=1 Tax=Mucilaginibacter pankratovii TaxID=2772110 RepID=A0ABR7WNW7_9SPHI|nr:hypothetical protein [Mucilaginibacter pankratovii]MBD1364014.1 hypothetical protein [Mucilaginibacter pankratovii]